MNAMQGGFQTVGRLDKNLTDRREAPGITASGFGRRDQKIEKESLRAEPSEAWQSTTWNMDCFVACSPRNDRAIYKKIPLFPSLKKGDDRGRVPSGCATMSGLFLTGPPREANQGGKGGFVYPEARSRRPESRA
jgi:hypothetical protein